MVARRLMKSLLAASALAALASGAHATLYTLNLSGSGGAFSSSDIGGTHTDRYDVGLTGFDPLAALSVEVGDEIVVNFSIADGPITLPFAQGLSLTSFYLTGDGFPGGDTATHGLTTLFNAGNQVMQGGDTVTTTSGGLASNVVFFGPVGPLTFDTVTSDFFVTTIDGSSDPGTFGVLDRGSLAAESRNPSAVPEPAAWTLMLAGFGGLGAMLRRRRALAAAI
jgi:hypothetical protein